jgi:hypothetical protein
MKVFQAYIGAEQRKAVSAAAIPWDVRTDGVGEEREYELFRHIWQARPCGLEPGEPWGLVSWKFELKTLLPVEKFHRFCVEQLAQGNDCAFINPMIGNEALYINVWEQGAQVHAGMGKIASNLRESKGLQAVDSHMGARSFAFCNFFVGTADFWARYFEFVEDMLGHLNSEAASASEVGATYLGRANHARDEQVSMRPFVIERLFSTFIEANRDLRVIGYPRTQADFCAKFGVQTGELLHSLYDIKHRGIRDGNNELLSQWDRFRRVVADGPLRWTVWQLDDPPPFLLTDDYQTLRRLADG